MENRASLRTYGSLDDPKLRSSDQSSSPSKMLLRDSMSSTAFANAPEHQRRGYGLRSMLAVALICAMGVAGTIMATNNKPRSAPTGTATAVVSDQDRTDYPNSSRMVEKMQPKQPTARPFQTSSGEPAVTASEGELGFTMTNFYHTRDGKPGAKIPWLQGVQLAEPHRETTLEITNPLEDHEYQWEVFLVDDDENDYKDMLASASGSKTQIVFTKLDWNKMVVKEVDESGAVTRTLTENVMVKYVRREIRTLTDDERNELFDSMKVLWEVRAQGGDGKAIYGENYADIWAINRLHFAAAAGFSCDHFHDGLGFLTNHAMMTNTFEYSLQLVNPKLTVPYWDFTIESSTAGGNTPETIEPQAMSPLFSEGWFGGHDPDDYQLKDGRWANTRIPRLRNNNPGGIEVDVYSKLRAPWNVNDRPFLSRSMGQICGLRVEEEYPWPTCQTHYDLTTSYSDFYSWVWESLYDPHGPVHVWLGGVMDCKETYNKISSLVGKDISAELEFYSFVHRKNLFRAGLFECTGSAGSDEKPAKLLQTERCGCLGYDLKTGDDYKKISSTMVFVDDLIGDFNEDTQRSVVASLCNGIMNDGDHLQASSSLDPSFWVAHPTMERLWMFKRLTGTMTDLTWPDSDVFVLDEDTGESSLEVLSLYDESCPGHHGSDVFPFGLGIDAGDPGFKARTAIKGEEDGGNTFTNREILQALDPRVNKLSYIYDTFEWTHCTEDGINMDDAWDMSATESPKNGKRPTFKQGEKRYPLYKLFKNKAKKLKTKKQSLDI